MNKKLFTILAIAGLILFLFNLLTSCSSPDTVAGGSIEVTNGYIIGTAVARDGAPIAGAIVSFYPKSFDKTTQKLPESYKDTTGVDGTFSIPSQSNEGTILVENPTEGSARVISGLFGPATTLMVVPRTKATLKIIGAGLVMEGVVSIMGTSISQPIHRGDSVIVFENIPVGSVRGISWTPTDSSVNYVIYPEFQILADGSTVIYSAGAGRFFNPPTELYYDTISVIARDSRGAVWIASPGKGIYKNSSISSYSWKKVAGSLADMKTVRSITVDHDTIYALGISQVHRSTDGVTFAPVSLPGGTGSPIALASGNGTIVAVWKDKAVWKNSAGTIRTFAGNQFSSVCFAGSDRFVLGTVDSGILTVTPTDSVHSSVATGLPSDSIRTIIASADGSLAILCAEGIAENRSGSWVMTKFSDKSLRDLATPRTIQFDVHGGIWCGGYNSVAMSDKGKPFRSQQNVPSVTRPYADFFSACEGYYGGILFGGIGGFLMMP